MDTNLSYVFKVMIIDEKNNSYIAASSAYKDGENAKKTHIQLFSGTKYAQSCRLM